MIQSELERFVSEDLGEWDDSSTLVPDVEARASVIAKEDCVVSGLREAEEIKTTPGFRIYEKRAAFLGGGDPHRFNLSGAVLIKDNHIRLMGLEECITRAKAQASFTKKIEVEVECLDQMQRAADMGVDIIMFDNMDPKEIEKGVDILKKNGQRSRLVLEASGGITPDNIEDYASTGVDVISLGWLTRNARWIDLSLEME